MKRIFLTALLMLALFTATSCSGNTENTSVTTAQPSVEETAQTATEYQLPVKDYDGYTLNAGVWNDCRWANTLFDVQEEVGEVVNDAIYLRNRTIEEKYNVVIKEIGYADPTQIANTMVKDFSADLHTFDLAFPLGQDLSKLIARGLAADLTQVPHLDFEKPWWDYGSVEDLSVGGKVYGVTGDIHYMSFDATWILTFNKKLIEDFNLQSPYELVRQNKWTFDTFYDMLKAVSSDIDGNGVYDDKDMYGFATHSATYWGLTVATGERYFTKDSEDMPVLKPLGDKMSTVYDGILKIMHQDNVTFDPTGGKYGDAIILVDVFVNDRALFMGEVMGALSHELLRGMKSDYGVLPWPKFDESQDRYYNYVHPQGAVMVIPSYCTDLDRTGLLAEALAYESYKTVRPAFYDTALRLKSSRDEESFEMLNLIFEKRIYELGLIYGWGNLCNDFANMGVKNKDELASLYSKSEGKVNADIAKFIESMTAVE